MRCNPKRVPYFSFVNSKECLAAVPLRRRGDPTTNGPINPDSGELGFSSPAKLLVGIPSRLQVSCGRENRLGHYPTVMGTPARFILRIGWAATVATGPGYLPTTISEATQIKSAASSYHSKTIIYERRCRAALRGGPACFCGL